MAFPTPGASAFFMELRIVIGLLHLSKRLRQPIRSKEIAPLSHLSRSRILEIRELYASIIEWF